MAEPVAPTVREAIEALERAAAGSDAAAFLAISLYYGRRANTYGEIIADLVARNRPDRADAAQDAEDLYDALFEGAKKAAVELESIMSRPRKPALRLVKKNRRRR